MSPVMLRPDLSATLEMDALEEKKSVNELVNEAVEHYLYIRQQAKIDQEIAAYETLHNQLIPNFLGHWVVIHEQKLIDHDVDRVALYRRVRSRFGHASVLIRQVQETPCQDLWRHTPSTGS